MKSPKTAIAIIAVVLFIMIGTDLIGNAQPPAIAEPNEPIDPNVTIDTTAPLAMKLPAPEPRKIVMPKDTKLPPRFKCPVHGTVNKSLLNIEIDGVIHTYCKKCAMQLVVDVFDLNLPRLINENP